MTYNFTEIEKKWKKYWDENKTFEVTEDRNKPKYFALVEFPYPSGAGLHVGHMKIFTGTDITARKKRMDGYNVLFPLGYDSFGLNIERYAIKTGMHPRKRTDMCIDTFRKQINLTSLSINWDREIDSSNEKMYHWTQWMFIQFYKAGLAYKSEIPMNWCPECKAAFANEELEDGCCERCGGPIEQRMKNQWTFKMAQYAEKLLDGLNEIEATGNIKKMQSDWIGKSVGAEIDFKVKWKEVKLAQPANEEFKPRKEFEGNLKVFTTRPDTIFGATFMVIAPEHDLLKESWLHIENQNEVAQYQIQAKQKTELQRQENKNKSGVKVQGLLAINPFTGEEIPVFIADYVMMGYGTGAIMAVPAHDQRDWEFAKKHNLKKPPVIEGGDIEKEAYLGDGKAINSTAKDGSFSLNGLNKQAAIDKTIEEIEAQKLGQKKTNYKMRDWPFSRQRYWGEPIPMVYCEKCGWEPMDEKDLPLRLPDVNDYHPTDTGESPLAKVDSWVNTTCPKCGGPGKRETDTMPGWAGSSWYWMRYMDPHNDKAFASKDALNYWGQVDLYNGGMEHVTRHLLYARFWNRVLNELGFVPHAEPFKKRTYLGLIMGPDGKKMSKSKGNVITPDSVIEEFGADTLRTSVVFIGPWEKNAAWDAKIVQGVSRFLNKVWRLHEKIDSNTTESDKVKKIMHRTIAAVGERIEDMRFNTAVSALMEASNALAIEKTIAAETLATFAKLLNPFAPHMAEELWEKLGNASDLAFESWPTYDKKYLVDDEVTIVLQVNGKNRSELVAAKDADKKELEEKALSDEKVQKFIDGKPVRKIIVVPNKLVNIVV